MVSSLADVSPPFHSPIPGRFMIDSTLFLDSGMLSRSHGSRASVSSAISQAGEPGQASISLRDRRPIATTMPVRITFCQHIILFRNH